MTENQTKHSEELWEPSPNGHIYKTIFCTQYSWNSIIKGLERLQQAENQRVCSETVNLSNDRTYTHKIIPM